MNLPEVVKQFFHEFQRRDDGSVQRLLRWRSHVRLVCVEPARQQQGQLSAGRCQDCALLVHHFAQCYAGGFGAVRRSAFRIACGAGGGHGNRLPSALLILSQRTEVVQRTIDQKRPFLLIRQGVLHGDQAAGHGAVCYGSPVGSHTHKSGFRQPEREIRQVAAQHMEKQGVGRELYVRSDPQALCQTVRGGFPGFIGNRAAFFLRGVCDGDLHPAAVVSPADQPYHDHAEQAGENNNGNSHIPVENHRDQADHEEYQGNQQGDAQEPVLLGQIRQRFPLHRTSLRIQNRIAERERSKQTISEQEGNVKDNTRFIPAETRRPARPDGQKSLNLF